MNKRFTDADKWERPWFRTMPHAYRSFWLYIVDKCDLAGVWYVDMEMATFMVGEPIDYEMAVGFLSKQILVLEPGVRWLIVDFVAFQQNGRLSLDYNPHKPIIALLKRHGLNEHLEVLLRPSLGPREGLGRSSGGPTEVLGKASRAPIVQVKVESVVEPSISRTHARVSRTTPTNDPRFDLFWTAYPKKTDKATAEEIWKGLNPDGNLLEKMLAALREQAASEQWTKSDGKYIPKPSSWLKGKRWEDELTTGGSSWENEDMRRIREEQQRKKASPSAKPDSPASRGRTASSDF